RLRRDRLDVLGRHALANHALHAGKPRTHLVLNELTDRANAAVTEVVNVIHVEADVNLLALARTRNRLLLIVQSNKVLDRGNDVFLAQHRARQPSLNAKLAVDLVTTNLREVIALRVEVEVVEKSTRSLCSNLLTRAKLAVNVFECL